MSTLSPPLPLAETQLIRFLRQSFGNSPANRQNDLIQRIAQLIDLSDSIRLSSLPLGTAQRQPVECVESAEKIRQDFLQVRATLIDSIAQSFSAQGKPGGRHLPQVPPGEFRPYLRFYKAHQRDMEFRIHNLQQRIRNVVSGLSTRFAALIELEVALEDCLTEQHRLSFASVSALLENHLENQSRQLSASAEFEESWKALLPSVQRDMRSLLLAELDARLLPARGLIEALEDELQDTAA